MECKIIPSLDVYFSLPANMVASTKAKRSGVPSKIFESFSHQAKIKGEHIKYKPQTMEWKAWLKHNKYKLIYCLCGALAPREPKYIGETSSPLSRINQHISEAVILNHPSKKNQWIRECSLRGEQIVLRPIMIVPKRKRLVFEKTIRYLMKQLGYSILNNAKPSSSVFKNLEEGISKRQISPFFLQLLLSHATAQSKVYDKLIKGIK